MNSSSVKKKSFNYEQSIWGRGTASLRWSDPAAFRLKMALGAIDSLRNSETSLCSLLCEGERDSDPPHSRVLELGCGAGQFIRAVKKLRPELECHGADISREAIAAAQKQNDGVLYAVSESERLPYTDEMFDAALIFDVLEHVENPASIVNEVRRVLKPGGIFYAFVPCEGDFISLWHLLNKLDLKKDLTKKYAGHIQYFSRRSLRELFRQSSFKLKQISYSEHLFGQLVGVAAFLLMDRAAKRQGTAQINNEAYFDSLGSRGIIKLVKNFINTLVYLESTLLRPIPSPNVHLLAKKI